MAGTKMLGRMQARLRSTGAAGAFSLLLVGAMINLFGCDGDGVTIATPIELTAKVYAGDLHTCALSIEGRVKCWGANSGGALGQGDTITRGDGPGEMGNNLPFVNLGTDTVVKELAVGVDANCALLDTGDVKCWGSNSSGGLGLGDLTHRGDSPGQMGDNLPTVNLGSGRTAKAIAMGQSFACAILDNDKVKCWGSNGSGRLGLGDSNDRGDNPGEMGNSLPYVNLGSGRTAVSIGAGAFHACALLDNGATKCWGDNLSGALGLGDIVDRGDSPGQMGNNLPAVALGGAGAAQAPESGSRQNCVILVSGAIKCWGQNTSGQLGLGDANNRGDAGGEMGNNLPNVALGTNLEVVQVVTGTFFSCARFEDGSVKCWGINSQGQLGLGSTIDLGASPGDMGSNLPFVDLGSDRSAVWLAPSGGGHMCAVLDDQSIKCWGDNDDGQLGQGDSNDRGVNPGEMGDNLPAVDLGNF